MELLVLVEKYDCFVPLNLHLDSFQFEEKQLQEIEVLSSQIFITV